MSAMHPVEGEELEAYLDNELEAERRTAVEQHLAACADCRHLLEELRQVSARLQAWQVEPAPPQLAAPPREAQPRVVGFTAERRRAVGRWVVAFGGVAAALLLVASLTIPNLLKRRHRATPPVAVDTAEKQPSPAPGYVAPEPPASRPARAARAAQEVFENKDVGGEADVVADLATKEERMAGAKLAVAKSSAARQMIAHQVSLTLSVKDFDSAKGAILAAVGRAGGYVAQASSAETPGQPRRADLVVRVPVPQLASLLDRVRGLGRVSHEQQSGEEVTAQYVDLEARIANARATEQRLVRVLAERTGKVRDILEVEREIARKREEIERMEAQRKHLENRAALATVQVALVEEFEAKLEPAPVGTGARLHNAFVAGYEDFVGMFVDLAIFFARNGLKLLFWGALLWLAWRSLRARLREWLRLWAPAER